MPPAGTRRGFQEAIPRHNDSDPSSSRTKDDAIMTKTFRMAPMDPPILWITTLLLALPILLLLGALFAGYVLSLAALILVGIYAWVWLRFRPRRFEVDEHSLAVIWPLKRRAISRADIASARLIDREELQKEIGSSLRLGAGGLWGGFGWLWTQRRGIVQIYVSRTDLFIWIERTNGRPWIVTPEQPENFVRALSR
jgi:hypothetical protein